jgi:hypothetical protein
MAMQALIREGVVAETQTAEHPELLATIWTAEPAEMAQRDGAQQHCCHFK